MGAARSLVLASASPRRRALLADAGVSFEVDPAGVDETLAPGVDPSSAARGLAEKKARAVAARRTDAGWVLGADTVVALGGPPWSFLEKPASPAEAAAMLARLSGTRHAVETGVSVVRPADGACWTDSERTWVTMRVWSPAEIAAYVASGEWRDKAGGYAIQESADRFVLALAGGGFDNVVGLPVARTLALLARAGASAALPGGARLVGEGGRG